MLEKIVNGRYVIIYPYKFVDTLYTIMGLDGFRDETEVKIIDISRILNKDFSDAVKAVSTLERIQKVNTLREFISEVRDIREQAQNINTCVNYMVPLKSMMDMFINLLCFLYFRNTKIKVLLTITPGIPIFTQSNKKRLIDNLHKIFQIKMIINKLYSFFWSKVPSPMGSLVTHKLIAGDYYLKREQKTNQNYRIINGHSFDYDRHLALKTKNSISNEEKAIVFLDEPGPLFANDYRLTGQKIYKTINVWYPTLSKFFDLIEDVYNSKVVIAAHYKSAFTSPSEVFGGREVFYGRTRDLIRSARLVVTEQSSAVSFAVIYNKPIFFIYSDESKNDLQCIKYIRNMSNCLEQPMYNINRLESIPRSLPAVDKNKYIKYENQFLTSDIGGPTNAQLIENVILV